LRGHITVAHGYGDPLGGSLSLSLINFDLNSNLCSSHRLHPPLSCQPANLRSRCLILIWCLHDDYQCNGVAVLWL
jgi:hypothetical protein